MTRLPTKYRDMTDHCVRCTERPTVHPDGLGTSTDARTVVLMYRCAAGHCWERTFRRADLNHGKAKASTAQRRHLAMRPVTGTTTPTSPTTTSDCTDEVITERTRAGRTPAPATGWNPERRAWLPR
jgi:hypothetical protein